MIAQVTSVSDLLNAIAETGMRSQKHAHVRVWFRGHGNKDWALTPGVFRLGFAKDDTERLLNERHLTQDFMTSSTSIRTFRDDAEAYFVQQHYRMPTRLLDWSLNPLAAVFFALDPMDKDGAIFALDAYRFRSDPPGRGLCTPTSDEIRQVTRIIFSWDNGAQWPKHILPVRPTNIDPRIASQRGCFTLHPPSEPELKSENNDTLRRWVIPSVTKEKLRGELELLGVDEFSIYGDLDRLAERLKRAYR